MENSIGGELLLVGSGFGEGGLKQSSVTNKDNSASDILVHTLEDGTFKCAKCVKVYKQKLSLIKHLLKNHGIVLTSSLSCEICSKEFDTERKLSRHKRETNCSKIPL